MAWATKEWDQRQSSLQLYLPEVTSVSCVCISRSSFLYGVFRALNGRTEDANATIPMADIRSELSSVLLCYGVCCILTPPFSFAHWNLR